MDQDKSQLLQRRDLLNFVRVRSAHPGDDLLIGELLVKTFKETYAKKLPSTLTTPDREMELRDVHSRRLNGTVRVIELGFQIIGTYALIYPNSALDESWTPNTCTLRCVAVDPRFHSLRLSDTLLSDAILMARKWNAENICLHVTAGARGVARLYENFGFERAPQGDKVSMGNETEGYLLQLHGRESNLKSC